MNEAVVELATALTNIVFPVPSHELTTEECKLAHLADHTAKHLGAGRYRSSYTSPSFGSAELQTSACQLTCTNGNSTASRISCFCWSRPPTSLYFTSGFSSAPSMAIDESASGGRISTRAFECRCNATEEDGFRSSRSSVERIRTT